MFCLCRFNFFSSLLQAATWQLWSLWIEQEYLLDCCSAFPFLIASPVSQGTGYGTLCANLMGIGSEFGFEEKTHLSPPKQSKNSPLWTNFAQDSLRAGWRLIWENSLHWKRKPDREELVFVIFSVHSRQKHFCTIIWGINCVQEHWWLLMNCPFPTEYPSPWCEDVSNHWQAFKNPSHIRSK